jgi:hypothetical protein
MRLNTFQIISPRISKRISASLVDPHLCAANVGIHSRVLGIEATLR